MVQAEQVARLSPDSEVERQAGDGQPTLFPSSARSPPAPPLEPRGAKGAAVPHQPLVADSHGNASLQTNDETNAAGPLMVHPRPRKNTWGSLDSRAEVGPGFHSTPPSRWAAHLTNSPSSMSPSADSYSHSHSHSHNSPAAHARHLSASSAGDSSGFSALGGSARPGHSRARSGGTDFDFFGPSSLTSGTTDATSFFPGSPTKSSHGPTSPASPWSHVSGSRGSGSGSGSGSRSGARGQSASPEAEREQAPRLDLGEPYALPFPSDGPLFGEQPDLHLGPRTDGEQSWNQNPLGLQIGTGLGGANTPAEMGPSQRARADEEPAEELHELEGNADEPVHEVDTNAGEGAEGVTSSGARLPSGHNQPENVADTDAGSARPYSGPSGQRSRPRPRNGILRAAAAALPGRLAKRVQSPKNAPDPSASTQPLHGDTSPSRRPVRRSESAPNLAWARAQESHRTNPYDQRETRRATASRPSSRPTTADSTSTSGSFSRLPLLASLRARSRQRRSPFSTTISSFTPAASSRSSPANSRTTSLINVSAPGQAPQRPGLGLYNCGYHSQGAATPNRSGRPKRKSHTRHLSLRSLSDMLLRDSGPESGTNATSSAEFHPSSLALDDGRDEEGGSSGRTREANLQPESKGKGRAQDLLPAAALTDGPSLAMNQRPAPTAGRQPSTPLRPTLLRTAYSTPITSPVPAVAVGHGSSSPAAPPPPSPTDLFDTLLPRELRIHVLGCLVNAHVHEHEEDVERGTWCGKIARETRFVGIEAAVRELARLSRVNASR